MEEKINYKELVSRNNYCANSFAHSLAGFSLTNLIDMEDARPIFIAELIDKRKIKIVTEIVKLTGVSAEVALRDIQYRFEFNREKNYYELDFFFARDEWAIDLNEGENK